MDILILFENWLGRMIWEAFQIEPASAGHGLLKVDDSHLQNKGLIAIVDSFESELESDSYNDIMIYEFFVYLAAT